MINNLIVFLLGSRITAISKDAKSQAGTCGDLRLCLYQ